LTEKTVDLPPVPADLKACFASGTLVPAPAAGQPRTERQVVDLIGQLKKSETYKNACGQRLITWYETVLTGLRGRK
jgi:hypothetical protein